MLENLSFPIIVDVNHALIMHISLAPGCSNWYDNRGWISLQIFGKNRVYVFSHSLILVKEADQSREYP